MSVGSADAMQNLAQIEDTVRTGLVLYKDNYLGFSFFRPQAWHRFDWLDGRRGVLFGPQDDNNSTLFGVAIQDLGLKVNEGDISDLHIGFISGIGRLPKIQVEWQDKWTRGNQIGMEAKYTFDEKGTLRKRWVRVIYTDTRQITLNAQGATPAEFDTWLPMFEQSMTSFRVHPAPAYKRKAKQAQKPAEN